MNIQVKDIDDITVLILTGDITSLNAIEVQEELLPLVVPGCRILIDMAGVRFLSSAGLRTLLMLYRRIEGQNSCIALANLPERIYDIMSVTGFLNFFATYPTEAEGVKALKLCEIQ
jgi:anti-sigma B factor antagonist